MAARLLVGKKSIGHYLASCGYVKPERHDKSAPRKVRRKETSKEQYIFEKVRVNLSIIHRLPLY